MKYVRKILFALGIVGICFALSSCGERNKSTRILFDQAHGQRFLVEKNEPLDLSQLAELFEAEGLTVDTIKDELTPERLAQTKALVISGPFVPYAPAEVKAVASFVQNGGRLCVMLHIASPLAELLKELGVAVSNGVIHEQENFIGQKDIDFRIKNLKPHALTQSLSYFNVYGAWALMNTRENASVIAESGQKSWVDLNMDRKLSNGDAMQALGVVVVGEYGKGKFAVFGDDAIFQNQFLKGENENLALNMIRWLETGK